MAFSAKSPLAAPAKLLLAMAVLAALGACSPEVGSKEWCDDLKKKDKGERSQEKGQGRLDRQRSRRLRQALHSLAGSGLSLDDFHRSSIQPTSSPRT
jgi:hypothetical protein